MRLLRNLGLVLFDDNLLLSYAKEKNLSHEILMASELFITNTVSGDMRDRFQGVSFGQ